MGDRFFTWPRLIFLVLFGYINYNVSMKFAYHQYFPFEPIDFLVLFTSAFLAAMYLFGGLAFGIWLAKEYSEKYEEKIGELIGILIAIIFGIAFNFFNSGLLDEWIFVF